MKPIERNSDEMIEKALRGISIPRGMGKDAVWERIIDRLEDEKQRSSIGLWPIVSKVAAVFIGLLLLGSVMWVFVLGNEKVYSPYGTHVEVNLPDGSVVKLNADSHIEYNKVLWSYNRKVTLKGEALFKVKKGEKFSVITGDVETQVLGTIFNIYSRNNEIRVSCIEGKVGVTHKKNNQSYTLGPNQMVSKKQDRLNQPSEVIELKEASWIKGEFYFSNEPLVNVLNEFQRQYNVKVALKTQSNRMYTGIFYANNLQEALDLICTPLYLDWEFENGVVIITDKR